MNFIDLIEKKKKGFAHTKEEINLIVDSIMKKGAVEDYQVSAWLMSVYFNGLNIDETTWLTEAMINSGETIDLSKIDGNIIDKHSTGGVGDKITPILIPLLAAAGVKVAKLSGRSLGHTGGTIDKLEAIPNFNCSLSLDELILQVSEIGLAIASQTQNLTPADGKLYALRDVTATVDSIPLIAASVISKKIASGSDYIILDVKVGNGAFLKTEEEAEKLSQIMIQIASKLGKKATAVISSMEQPLGFAVGNSLEMIESIEFLKGNMPEDLKELIYELASLALIFDNKATSKQEAFNILDNLISSKKALNRFEELIKAQNGNVAVINDYKTFPQAKFVTQIFAENDGYVKSIDALKIAKNCKALGAGRQKKTDEIDYSVGIVLNKKVGDEMKKGDLLISIYSNSDIKNTQTLQDFKEAFSFSDTIPEIPTLIYKVMN